MKGYLVGTFLIATWFCAGSSRADDDNKNTEPPKDFLSLYAEMLAYQAHQPEYHKKYGTTPFPLVSAELIGHLPPERLKLCYNAYLKDFLKYRKIEKEGRTNLPVLQKRLDALPLTDSQHRPQMELKIASLTSSLEKAVPEMFLISFNANKDFLRALQTLPASQRTVSAPKEKPKMPGVYGGSIIERDAQKDDEKIFLTPVDKEFYDTQLGKKLEKDLGGRAEYWSYDFDKDELYVRVNGDTGKVYVLQDGSTRFIKTRNGQDFRNIAGPDEKVDPRSKGRFLTGNKDEEALFGDMPSNKPALMNEPGKGSGH